MAISRSVAHRSWACGEAEHYIHSGSMRRMKSKKQREKTRVPQSPSKGICSLQEHSINALAQTPYISRICQQHIGLGLSIEYKYLMCSVAWGQVRPDAKDSRGAPTFSLGSEQYPLLLFFSMYMLCVCVSICIQCPSLCVCMVAGRKHQVFFSVLSAYSFEAGALSDPGACVFSARLEICKLRCSSCLCP